ncbi:hypothetical protein JK636_10410 [Clostridium sp. YIM B02515]|uniref:Transglutaminase-like domain-containing protein n=1 Tax=Clostridium rhizosphaerae TaxID=2803861 RepID=A0ABS1TC10_9CLOT|nr:transglutaminase domain-containing protein [Clostridium rhizosphaerae]MBL4936171.1 hypothetical protein [Clostridium rhizosphaerae]
MLLTERQREKIEKRFEEIRTLAAHRENPLFQVLDSCNEEEQICLKFLYAYMPLSDLANYDGKLFLKFVRHALKVRKLVPWGESIDGLTFLNYVLQYRINNENIEFYSEEFFNEIYPRIKGKGMYEAAIEVNYWCLEKATYQSTDIRTLSPFSIIRNAYGRCGEESVLTIAALRSVFIPARQCYTPRWAHCDDNHAWVEVLIDGKWNYLGACEPEIRLNTGWFELPASRGMLMHSRVFSDMTENELITSRTGHLTEVNLTPHYAETRELVVKVVGKEGRPLKDIDVKFEIINFAEFFPLAHLKTNSDGVAKFITGLGDIVVFAHSENEYCYQKVDVRKTTKVELVLGENTFETEPALIEMVPPVGGIKDKPLTKEQEAEQKKRGSRAEEKRKAYEATLYNTVSAKEYAKKYLESSNKIETFLINTRGNYDQIIAFLEDDETNKYFSYKIDLLESLQKKDLSDITKEILKEHLTEAMPFADEFEREIFVNYILCPRISNEMIFNYRRYIAKSLTDKQIIEFRDEPEKVENYIREKIQLNNELEYSNLSASPVGALELGVGNELTMKIAFVAVLRTLGIPARIEKTDGSLEFYKNGTWNIASESLRDLEFRDARLVLLKKNADNFVYHKNYSVAILENGAYKSLDFEDIQWQSDTISYNVKPGKYRVMTANRLPDGTIDSCLYFTEIESGCEKAITLSLQEKDTKKMRVPLEDRKLVQLNGETIHLSQLLKEKNIVAWLDVGAEPTEHLLNEMIEASDDFNKKVENIVFVLSDKEELNDPTLQKTLEKIPHIKQYLQQEEAASLADIYDGFSIGTKGMPLVLVVEKDLVAVFAMSGYHVGIGELLLENLLKK